MSQLDQCAHATMLATTECDSIIDLLFIAPPPLFWQVKYFNFVLGSLPDQGIRGYTHQPILIIYLATNQRLFHQVTNRKSAEKFQL